MANLGTYSNPVNGGWYNNPQGQNQQWLNGQWQNAPGSASDPLSQFNALNANYNDALNSYYNTNEGFAQKQHDLTTNNLNTANTLALGTQNPDAQASFLNSIYTPDMKNQGSLEYGYNMNANNENAMYGLQTQANTQNRKLALDKLSNDENFALQGMGLNQGKENAATIDSLNQRGLLYGQTPTGQYQPNAMGGMHGLAGQQAGLVNQDYGIQRGLLTSDYGLNTLGTNQQYNQLQAQQSQTHNYNLQNLAYDTSNNINNQNNNYTYQTGVANNQLAQYKSQQENLKKQNQLQNQLQAQTNTMRANNIPYQ